MKKNLVIITTLLLLIFPGCHKDIVVNKRDTQKDNTPSNPQVKPPTQGYVNIVYNLRSDFPDGPVQPDLVTKGGTPITEGALISTGSFEFTIERRGYKRKVMTLNVRDDGDGNFRLVDVLEAKERLIRFNITDKTTNEYIEPDKVILADGPDELNISDGSYVKPGVRIVVIQKKGYENFSDEFILEPGDEPYTLEYPLQPIE